MAEIRAVVIARARLAVAIGPTEQMAAELEARSRLAAALRKAAEADSGSTVRAARSSRVDTFAAAIAALWQRLLDGEVTEGEYQAEVATLWRQALKDVPAEARETVTRLEQQALSRAGDFLDHLSDETKPPPPLLRNWSNMLAGTLWAATLVTEAAGTNETVTWQTQGDQRVCDSCRALNGKMWAVDDVPFWPGEGQTDCEGNCRCDCS